MCFYAVDFSNTGGAVSSCAFCRDVYDHGWSYEFGLPISTLRGYYDH